MADQEHQQAHGTPRQPWLLLLFPLVAFLVSYWLAAARKRASQRRLPPSPPALPFIGHLHLVGAQPHVALRRLAARHGPDLMLLRLGAQQALVASSPRAAEAVLRTHDHVFASRPHSAIADIMTYGTRNVGFAPYGEHWRQTRKLVTVHLVSMKKVQSLRHVREDEVGKVMARIDEAAAAGAAVDITELLTSFANNVVCRAVSGKFSRSEGLIRLPRKLLKDTSDILASFNVEEYFPMLARASMLRTTLRSRAERAKKGWDELMDKLIDEHEEDFSSAASSQKEDDFINILLSMRQEFGLSREGMKAILVDIFFGAIDTTANAIEFTIAELLRCPSSMKKLQAELTASMPQGQQIISGDNMMNGLTYLRAVIEESLRLHPLAPLLVPHFSMADCTIDGYTVPRGTRVIVNAWAIGRDTCSWKDADVFMPERFLPGGSAEGIGFKGNFFQFLPFGAGRRMCAGMNFGIANVEMLLANLVHRFNWELPPGLEKIDMSEVLGVTVQRKEKLILVPKIRV